MSVRYDPVARTEIIIGRSTALDPLIDAWIFAPGLLLMPAYHTMGKNPMKSSLIKIWPIRYVPSGRSTGFKDKSAC